MNTIWTECRHEVLNFRGENKRKDLWYNIHGFLFDFIIIGKLGTPMGIEPTTSPSTHTFLWEEVSFESDLIGIIDYKKLRDTIQISEAATVAMKN